MIRIDTPYTVWKISLFGSRNREMRCVFHSGDSIQIIGLDVDEPFGISGCDGPFPYVFDRIKIRYACIVRKIAELTIFTVIKRTCCIKSEA